MKVDKRTRKKALSAPPADLILLHGTDAGGISEASASLLAGTEIARFTPPDIKEDPACLYLRGGDLFASSQSVRVDDADDTLVKPVEALLASGGPEVRTVLRAGQLKAASRLRKLIEGHKKAVGILISAPDHAERVTLARAAFDAADQRVGADVLDALAARLPADSAAARQEVEKVLLYADGAQIDIVCVERAIADAASQSIDEALAGAFDGDPAAAARAWSRLEADGTAVIQMLRSAGTHVRQLMAVEAARAGGTPPAKAVAALKPPPFGSRRDALIRHAGFWRGPDIARALDHVETAEIGAKTGGIPPDLAVRQLFWTLAARARALKNNRKRP